MELILLKTFIRPWHSPTQATKLLFSPSIACLLLPFFLKDENRNISIYLRSTSSSPCSEGAFCVPWESFKISVIVFFMPYSLFHHLSNFCECNFPSVCFLVGLFLGNDRFLYVCVVLCAGFLLLCGQVHQFDEKGGFKLMGKPDF